MSTTPTPAPPTIQQTQEELKTAALATPAPPQAQPTSPAAPAPDWGQMTKEADGTYVIKTKFGEEFKGSADDVLAKLAEAKVRTREHYEAKAAQLPQPSPTPTPQAPTPVAEDPATVAAREFILTEVAKGVGLSSADELKERLNLMASTTEDIRSQSLAASFMAACPEFPNTPDACQALGNIMNSVGLPNTVEGMKAAHALALYQKAYAPLQANPQQITTPNPPPPGFGAGASIPQGGAVDLWKIPMEQLRDLASKK